MKRLLRYILNGLMAISLLLCSLTLLAWQSGRSEMIWMGWSFHYALELGWHDGRIFAGDQTITSSPTTPWPGWTFHHIEGWRDDDDWSGSPGVFRWDFKPEQESWYVIQPREASVPCWLIVLVTAILPLLKLPRLIRWFGRDDREGCCQACGYDLRASPERCPECGTLARQKREPIFSYPPSFIDSAIAGAKRDNIGAVGEKPFSLRPVDE